MRKEIYKIKNPKHIVFGDPLYFEDFKGAELKRLTVDYKPPKSFDAARLVLLEKPNEKYPRIHRPDNDALPCPKADHRHLCR